MSAKDTVGDKLVATIKKTKAEASESLKDSPQAKPAVPKKASKKKAVKSSGKKKAAAKAPAAKPVSSASQSNKQQAVNAFQRRRRVWPD